MSRKRNVCRFVAAVVLVLAIALGSSYGPMGATPAQTAERPNIVLILTDDLDARSVSRLTKLKSLMTDQGTTFNRTFVTTSLCCPSRASILRGQYPHNHQIVKTSLTEGFEKFRDLGHENSTIATWLQSGGYRTIASVQSKPFTPWMRRRPTALQSAVRSSLRRNPRRAIHALLTQIWP